MPACSTVCKLATLGWSAWHRLFFHPHLHQSGLKKPIRHISYIRCDFPLQTHYLLHQNHPKPKSCWQCWCNGCNQLQSMNDFTRWPVAHLDGDLLLRGGWTQKCGSKREVLAQSNRCRGGAGNRVMATLERGRIASLPKKHDRPWKNSIYKSTQVPFSAKEFKTCTYCV